MIAMKQTALKKAFLIGLGLISVIGLTGCPDSGRNAELDVNRTGNTPSAAYPRGGSNIGPDTGVGGSSATSPSPTFGK